MIGKIWSVFFSFSGQLLYTFFLLLLSKVDLIHQTEKMREFLKFTATQHTSLLLLCDFFVVFLYSSDEYKSDYCRDISSFNSSLREFYCRDVKWDTRIFPYRSRLVPRPVVPPMDSEDVQEALRLQQALDKADDADDVKVLDVAGEIDGVPVWEVERVVGKRPSKFGPRGLSLAQRGFDYKVVWRPEGMYADSWEPEANLSSAAEAIQAYEESLPAPSQDSGQVRRSSRLQGVYVYSDFAMPLFHDDPVSRSQALSSPFVEQWIEAEIDELQSIQEMGVWTLVDLKPGMHVLGSKFVYKTKRNPDGTVQNSNWGGSLHDSNQSRPAISSLEAEFNGLEFVCRELEWTCDFLAELKINVPKPVQVFQDNMGALALAKDPIMRPRTKYFRISQHYVRWCRMVGKADFHNRAGSELVADMLTKPLGLADFTRHRKLLMGPQDQEWPNRVEEEEEKNDQQICD